MKDAIIVGPILAVGVVMLRGAAEASWGQSQHLVSYMLFLVLLFGLLFLWYRGKHRAAERLKAMELGRSPAELGLTWTPGRVCVTVGTWVPLGLFAIAGMATLNRHPDNAVIWISAAAMGITVLVCGTYLMTRLPASSFTGSPPTHAANGAYAAKPEAEDPDAYDFVGRRG